MKIAIFDHDFNRVIVAEVPAYLADADRSSDDIAQAVFDALGISSDTEYMIGEFDAYTDLAVLNGGKGYGDNVRRLDEYTANFQEDALASLEESAD